jgi:hypothetical protein
MGLSRLGNVLSVMMWAMEVYNLQLAHAWFVSDKIKWPPARHTHKKKLICPSKKCNLYCFAWFIVTPVAVAFSLAGEGFD